jgi:hypothetical protein
MLQHRFWSLSRRTFRHLTGLTPDEFVALLPSFTQAYHAAQHAAWVGQTRQRRPGGGRRGALPTAAHKLLFILVYVRLYPTQELQGVLFGLSQPQANTWLQTLLPVLQATLGREDLLPCRPATASLERLLGHCPDLQFLLDATERPLLRPQTRERRDAYWSGKRHTHTQKTTLITNATGRRIAYLGTPQPGRQHDKTDLVDEPPPWPPGSTVLADLGYLGYRVAEVTVHLPARKPRELPRPPEHGPANTRHAQRRVRVEHAIRGLKLSRCTAEVLRTRRDTDRYAEVAAGLYNYRMVQRQVTDRAIK